MPIPSDFKPSEVTIGLLCPTEIHRQLLDDVAHLLADKYESVAWQLFSEEELERDAEHDERFSNLYRQVDAEHGSAG